MDADRFDHLTRWVSAGGNRRKILAFLTSLPLGGMVALQADGELAEARRRKQNAKQRKKHTADRERVDDDAQPHKKHCRRVKGKGHGHHGRRKNCQAHHGGKGKDKDKPQACQPESVAQTCADRCGSVQNNCQQTVDCGSCTCQPTCPTCQRCNETTTTCEPDPNQVGDTCGDGLVCQDDGQCACQGNSCGGCRTCEDSRCVVDATIVCTAQDQCHVAGVCDPATGACTNPRRDDGASCDDGDPCTLVDVCQNGACRGTPKDCAAAGDICNDGVCRADGTCGKRAKADGTGCNADNDSCTEGDSCQNGVCTPGAGVNCSSQDDQCNRGVCRQSDGTCGKEPRQDGTPCGDDGTCQGGVCQEAVCKELGDTCNPANNRCCQDDPTSCAALAPNCYASGDPQDERCCHETRETCGGACDCCGLAACEGGTCCNYAGGACEVTADCCTGGNVSPTCVSGTCCVLEGQYCEDDGECCTGTCADNVCLGCLPLRQECESNNECCQSGGQTLCRESFDFNSSNCCRPTGGTCSGNNDCCNGRACNNGRCCEGEHFQCDADADCCSGLECRGGICRSNICLDPGESCPPGSPACCPGGATCSDGTCCYQLGEACVRQGECCHSNGYTDCGGQNGAVCCIQDFAYAFIDDGACSSNDQCCSGYCHSNHMCCRPQGAACTEIGALTFECCPYLGLTCSANGAGTCIPCRKPGESCTGSGTSSTCCLGSDCQNGTCVVENCGVLLSPCQDDSTCCPGWGCNTQSAVCLRVCQAEGEGCDPVVGFNCCSGLTCTGEYPSKRCTRTNP